MRSLLRQSDLRGAWLRRLLELLVLAAVVAGCVVGYTLVRMERDKLMREQIRHEALPEARQQTSALQRDLRERAHDIERILQLVVDPQDIATFVGGLEESAGRAGIVLEVPVIEEVAERVGEEEGAAPADNPLRSIRMKIVGRGKPLALLDFLHELEYGPYLVALADWKISTAAGAGSFVVGSARLVGEEEIESARPAAAAGQLDAEIIVLVHNENYESK